MCHVGAFNLSQASLTSVAALSALHKLPKTNLALHYKFTGKTTAKPDSFEGDFEENSEDDSLGECISDIPVDVVVLYIMSNRSIVEKSFEVDGMGGIVRTGVAKEMEMVDESLDENPDAHDVLEVPLGHGLHVKIASNKYGQEWELY
jgi:hypothetical protein